MPFDEAWRVEVKIRSTGTSLGTTDAVGGWKAGWVGGQPLPEAYLVQASCLRSCAALDRLQVSCCWEVSSATRLLCASLPCLQYYFSPAGKRYRSRMEVGVALGRAHRAPYCMPCCTMEQEGGANILSACLPCLPCPQIARDFGLADDKPPKASGAGTSGSGRSRKSEGGGGGGGGTPSVPLSREVALAAAQKRLAAFQLPHTLECGVTVTNLGALRPNDAGAWQAGLGSVGWNGQAGGAAVMCRYGCCCCYCCSCNCSCCITVPRS